MKNTFEELATEFERALLMLDKSRVQEIIAQARTRSSLQDIIDHLIIRPLTRIGEGWESGTIALSQVYMSGRICEELIDQILPPSAPERKVQPRMAIAALLDCHALGKRIIYSTLRANGFELQDFGHGQTVEALAQKAREHNIQILFVSVLMYPTALKLKALTESLKDSHTKIMVGGAPFVHDSNLWKQVGADAMGTSAADAINYIHSYTQTMRDAS